MRLTDINQQQNSHSTTRSGGGSTPVGLSSSSSAANPAAAALPSLRWSPPPPSMASMTALDDALHHHSNSTAPHCRPHHIVLAANLTSNSHQVVHWTAHSSPPTMLDSPGGALGSMGNPPRKATNASPSSGKPPVDNPFEAWFRSNKPSRNPRAAPRRAASAVASCSFSAFGDFPPPPPPSLVSAYTSSCPSMSVGGDCTDNEDDMDDHPMSVRMDASPSNDARRRKAVEDAQRYFRCMDMACMLDMDDNDVMPPPALVRAQAQLLLHHEDVALTCRKCGATEYLAISY